MTSMLQMIIMKFRNAFRGIYVTVLGELSFKIELLGGLVLLVFGYVVWPLEAYEVMALVITYGLVLVIELVNTSFETSLERLHPEMHELIGKSKDVAAGAVVVAILLLVSVVAIILFM